MIIPHFEHGNSVVWNAEIWASHCNQFTKSLLQTLLSGFLNHSNKSREIKRFFFSGGVIDYSGNLIIIVAFCEKLFTVYYKSS